MVGRALVKRCTALGDEVLAYDHESLNIADAQSVSEIIMRERPESVINCAAWTDVDGCESNSEKAFAVNARGPENLAAACRKADASFIHISTDYVFDGAKHGFYTQRDNPNPQSVYAASKLEGERRAQLASARTIVVRSGWIFGEGGRNILSSIIARTRRSQHLKLIYDSWGTPTYAPHLVARLRELAALDLPGIYHVVNSGDGASYEEFALLALDAAGLDSSSHERISADSLKRAAPRPRNARLRCLLSEAIGLQPLPFWKDALKEFAAREAEN